MEENIPWDRNSQSNPIEVNGNNNPNYPPPPLLHPECPRCKSSDTKFCYYNNYSVNQPRYNCKSCRRNWTYGGALRDVPVGGGSRKSKMAKTSSGQPSSFDKGPRSSAPHHPILGQGFSATGIASGNSFQHGGNMLPSLAAIPSINQPLVTSSSSANRFEANLPMVHDVNFSSIRPYVPLPQFNTQCLSMPGFMRSSGPSSSNMGGASTQQAGVRDNLGEDDDDHLCNQNCSSGKAAQNHHQPGRF